MDSKQNIIVEHFDGGNTVLVPSGRKYNTILVPYGINESIHCVIFGEEILLAGVGSCYEYQNRFLLTHAKVGYIDNQKIKFLYVIDKLEEGFKFRNSRNKINIF